MILRGLWDSALALLLPMRPAPVRPVTRLRRAVAINEQISQRSQQRSKEVSKAAREVAFATTAIEQMLKEMGSGTDAADK